MATKQTHTPGQMKASTTTLKSSNFADHVAHVSIGPKIIGRINGGVTEEKAIALANATRIALCWNMHDEMAEALRAWIAFFDYAGLEPGHVTKSRADRHRAILAKLEGAA